MSDQSPLWALTDHCCRVCFSRVLVRETFDHRKIYRCAGCGIEKEGRAPSVICSCGIKLKTGADAGLRCAKNENVTPEFPSEITAISAYDYLHDAQKRSIK
jgi:hypothetical protein